MHLADVNDHSPRFDDRIYTASVYENEKEGTLVIKVRKTGLEGYVSGHDGVDRELVLNEIMSTA